MQLFYRKYGEGGMPVVILHGVFGSSDNWVSVGKALAKHFSVYLLDLRNHGKSPHSEKFSYQVMSDDVNRFMEEKKLQEAIIIGHSMGGKVAMLFAFSYQEKVRRLIVVDMAPKYYAPHHAEILEGLSAIDLEKIQYRKQADEILSAYVSKSYERQFLLKNLYRKPDNSFAWRINLPVISKRINEIGNELHFFKVFNKPTLFVAGENSNYIFPEDHKNIRTLFSKAIIVGIPKAGHWVHADQPNMFLEAIMNFMRTE